MPKGKSKRDPNTPVATFTIGTVGYEIRYTGPHESCQAQYNPKHSWGGTTPSLIVTRRDDIGLDEVEHDPYSPNFWKWITHLICSMDISRERCTGGETTPREDMRRSYLRFRGGNCPFCKSSHIEDNGSPEIDENWVDLPAKCNNCGKEWTDHYLLHDFSIEGESDATK